MGTDYYLANHCDLTLYELGKGSWYDIDFHSDNLLNELKVSHDIEENYLKLICMSLKYFIGNTPNESLYLFGDGGDDLTYAKELGYTITGSRYHLDSPDYDYYIKGVMNFNSTPSTLYEVLDEQDMDRLKREGWNFSKYKG